MAAGNEPWLLHERHQHAVGQGGFHSGEVRSKAGSFWYVYDCGSSNRDALDREQKQFSAEHGARNLDLLVLSHLDEDHVNGVERLLAERDVTTVLIPYLDSDERLLLVVEGCERGTLTESRWEMYENPSRWFYARGASVVIQVLPARPEPPAGSSSPDGPLHPDAPLDLRSFMFQAGHLPDVVERTSYPNLDRADRVVRSGEALQIRGALRGPGVWEFVPFCHPELERVREFRFAIRRMFGLSSRRRTTRFIRSLRDVLLNKGKRAELKELYGRIWSNHNLSSMSLYSGPQFDWPNLERRILVGNQDPRRSIGAVWPDGRFWYTSYRRVGWIGTGDASLVAARRASRFEAHYRRLLPRVGSFMVPHHGSKNNSGGHLFRDSLRPSLWYAPAGRNQFGHPDQLLRHGLERRAPFVKVSHRSGDTLSEYFQWLPQR